MKTYDFNEFLNDKGIEIFTLREASRIIGKPQHYTSLFLKRDKAVKRAIRGLYYTKGADLYGVASRIIYPSYVSLISAFRVHNITEQIPNIIYVISSRRHAKIENLEGYSVVFKTVKPSMMFGYGNFDGIIIAEPEKAAIDMVYLNEFVEYAEEAAESGKLNLEKLERYASMTSNKRVVKWAAEMAKRAKSLSMQKAMQ